jgi:Mg/Co/Ni transporter MgtE
MLKLAEKRGDTIFFLMAVADNFYELPEDVKTNILLDLLEKDAAAWAVARVVANKPDTLPEDVTAWLFKLSEYDEAVWEVARAVVDSFDKFPDDARNKLLLNLSEKDVAAWAVLFALVYNLDTFPDDVRNNLLLNLSEKDAAVWWPNENAIAYNFDKLPANVRNSLDGLPEPLQQVIEANVGFFKFIEAIPRIKERLQTICLKANTLSLLYPNFVLKMLNKK